MFPEIVFCHRVIPLYGICAAVGAILALFYLRRYEKSCSHSLAGDIDLAMVFGLIGGMVGAKTLYLLVNLRAFLADLAVDQLTLPLIQKYFYGGFVFYGGLIGYLLALVLYARHSHIAYRDLERPLLPSFVLFHAFGRIGCFFTGCCYGIPTAGFWGIAFTHSAYAPNGIPLFPVQLFEAGGEAILFFILHALSKRKAVSLTGIYLLCYGAMRFVLEFFRGDAYRGRIWVLSVSQAISIVGIAIGIYLILKEKKMTVK